jgi:DNA-directed RNA polymerase I subunit RPA2
MQNAALPHLDSFDFMLKESLPRAVGYLEKHELDISGERVVFWVQDANISRPSVGRRDNAEASRALYPWECRERRVTYQADLQLCIQVQVGDNPVWSINKIAGQIPIMVKSDRCYLKGLSPVELVRHHEEAQVRRA